VGIHTRDGQREKIKTESPIDDRSMSKLLFFFLINRCKTRENDNNRKKQYGTRDGVCGVSIRVWVRVVIEVVEVMVMVVVKVVCSVCKR